MTLNQHQSKTPLYSKDPESSYTHGPAYVSPGGRGRHTHSPTLRGLKRQVQILQIENSRLARLAITDELTGAFNRRGMQEISASIFRCKSRGEALAMCLVDFDGFKSYNDRYGHLKGDRALRGLVVALYQSLPADNAWLFRSGGDEFCMLFYASSPAVAFRVAARARAAVHTLRMLHEGRASNIVTASFGMSWLPVGPREDRMRSMLLGRADNALYRAKHAGKDCICMD